MASMVDGMRHPRHGVFSAALVIVILAITFNSFSQALEDGCQHSRLYHDECRALVDLHHLFDQNSFARNWPDLAYLAWNLTKDPCKSWYGVLCAEVNGGLNRTVTSLDLSGKESVGYGALLYGAKIPDSIMKLKNLTSLDLSSNYFSSYSISNSSFAAWNLPYLQNLTLKNNVFMEIPYEIATLPMLQFLDFSNNPLSPPLRSNVGTWDSLVYFNLSRCSVYGSVPYFIRDMVRLKVLDLSHNQLSGSIPDWLGELRNLQYLNLDENRFSGQAPWFLYRIPEVHLNGNIVCSRSFGSPCKSFSSIYLWLVVAVGTCIAVMTVCATVCIYLNYRGRREGGAERTDLQENPHGAVPVFEEAKDESTLNIETRPSFPVVVDGKIIGMAYADMDTLHGVPESGHSSGTER